MSFFIIVAIIIPTIIMIIIITTTIDTKGMETTIIMVNEIYILPIYI